MFTLLPLARTARPSRSVTGRKQTPYLRT